MRSSRAQRSVVYVMIAVVAVALAIGLWPVHAAVFGDPSYNCGSGFFHSGHKWKQDSQLSRNERTGKDDAAGPPSQVCPSKVYNNRDSAILLAAFAVVIGVVVLALIQGPDNRQNRAIFASMRLRKR